MGTEPTEEVIALGGVQNVCIRPPKANASLAYRNAGNPPAQLVYVARCSPWRRRQDVDPNSYRRGFRFRHECPAASNSLRWSTNSAASCKRAPAKSMKARTLLGCAVRLP